MVRVHPRVPTFVIMEEETMSESDFQKYVREYKASLTWRQKVVFAWYRWQVKAEYYFYKIVAKIFS